MDSNDSFPFSVGERTCDDCGVPFKQRGKIYSYPMKEWVEVPFHPRHSPECQRCIRNPENDCWIPKEGNACSAWQPKEGSNIDPAGKDCKEDTDA